MKNLFLTRLLLTLYFIHSCKSENAPKPEIMDRNLLPINNSCTPKPEIMDRDLLPINNSCTPKPEIMDRNLLPINNSCTSNGQLRGKRSFSPTSSPLHCPPCEQIHCFKQKKRRLRCKGGWTLGICGCCKVCAKLEGEQCGGQHDYLGKCDEGLECEAQQPKVISVERNGVKTVYKIETGTCKKVSTKKLTANRPCKQKCSFEFCSKNPRGICSAKDNAETLQKCQGNCQHTSCRACKYVFPDQQCSSCSKNDFKCMREFGRCVRKMSCRPKEYPCGSSWMNPKHEAIFHCKVPDCPD